MRLFGQQAITLRRQVESSVLEITAAGKAPESIDEFDWEISHNLISCTLKITNQKNHSARKFKLPKSNAVGLRKFLFLCQNQNDIEPLSQALAQSMNGENYFSFTIASEINWHFEKIILATKSLGPNALVYFPEKHRETVGQFIFEQDNCRQKYNQYFVSAEAERWSDFFQSLEDNPLTAKQIESVVTEEDATLVVAGAGTGKTSSVVGKIGYLLESGRAKPEGILALAFNRDAAQEMRERVFDKTGHKIEIRTFHSYGKNLIENGLNEKLKIADFEQFERAKLAHVNSILAAMYQNGEEANLIVNFLSFHRYPAKFREDFDRNKDYLTYMAKQEPVTLNEEWVKSFEELLIADWLAVHGIRYEYEKPYEHRTGSRFRRQYQPDFYLSDYDIYLEHFGIDRNGNTAPWIDKDNYNRSIEWKRKLHKENKTKLIETYSWERMEGILSSNLKKKLEAAGVPVIRQTTEVLQEKFKSKRINEKLVSLVKDFLSVFKEGQWTIDELKGNLNAMEAADSRRCHAFLGIFKVFYGRYTEHLDSRGELDFADLIAKATDALVSNSVGAKFSHIIVDEFQDISRGRSAFLKSIRSSSSNSKLMCVGDDWQSIYGFTGSDVHITTKFRENFGFFQRVDLDRTFRFRQPLIDVSSRFVQRNPSQLKKEISGRDAIGEKELEVIEANENDLKERLEGILKDINKKTKSGNVSVLFLGRYNFTKPEFFQSLADKYSSLNVNYMTIHKSKGLQADYIVILGLENAKFGFPGSIASDPIMNLVRPSEEDFEDAEERRVFYVALTRAKEKVYLVKPINPSKFLNELMDYDEVEKGALQTFDLTCPDCGDSNLHLKFPNRVNGYAWHCSYGRYCGGKAKFCGSCGKFPEISGVCVDPACKPKQESKPKKVRRRKANRN